VTARQLDADAQRRLEALPPELRVYASVLLPDPAIEAEAQRLAEERRSAERTAWFLEVRELCQRAKAGEFGPPCKEAVEATLGREDLTKVEKAEACAKMIQEARKTLAAAKAKATRGRGAP
jgi:hypothetical protein